METYFDRYVVAGGIMMFLLVPTAFLAIAFIVQGFINLRKGRVMPELLLERSRSLKTKGERADFVEALGRARSAAARCVVKLIERREKSGSGAEADVMTDAVEEEVARLYHQNSQLAVIYPVAPLMGLLGTIIGMMKAFYEFSVLQEHSIEQLSQGINEALVTTMWGLFIAIPAFVFLSIFRHRLYRYEADLLPGMVREIVDNIDSADDEEEAEKASEESEEKAGGAAEGGGDAS
jgi:biopolymer transport protein ExbB